jgi:hypothetical protein
MDRWLQEWEARRLCEPSLTPEQFLAGLEADLPPELLDAIRAAITDLDWMTDLLQRMKDLDRQQGSNPRGDG